MTLLLPQLHRLRWLGTATLAGYLVYMQKYKYSSYMVLETLLLPLLRRLCAAALAGYQMPHDEVHI